jgi:hypothetical protein
MLKGFFLIQSVLVSNFHIWSGRIIGNSASKLAHHRSLRILEPEIEMGSSGVYILGLPSFDF